MLAKPDRIPLTEAALRLPHELSRRARPLASTVAGEFRFDVRRGIDAVWLHVTRGAGDGGMALRLCPLGPGARLRRRPRGRDLIRFEVETAIGVWRAELAIEDAPFPVVCGRLALTPQHDLIMPYLGRDLFAIGADGSPQTSVGQVEAAQRGLNTGLMFLRLTEPRFGSVLYVQDLTALNGYFRVTGTKPDGAVGGSWPELGYLPPAPDLKSQPGVISLSAGVEVVVSRPLMALHGDFEGEEEEQARRFVQLLGEAYLHLERPACAYRDWPERARRTWHDLATSPLATISHYGARYVRPYTDAEYPDCMVQLTLLAAMRDWQDWSGDVPAPSKELRKGLAKFHDTRLKTLRRYLPNVGADKDADAVDSWYMYHPLLNLARLAHGGDAGARTIFFDSLERGIEAARHFDYKWPIQFKITDFSVITPSRDDEGHGQTDVGGIYAYVMAQAFSLSDDRRYLAEARAALEAARGSRFELDYQANLSAWGVAACLRLWRITDDEQYLRQSYIFFASFLHNCAIWESEIGYARHYRNFLGATALHDAPYMALYECFDSFRAMEESLKLAGPQLEPGAHRLMAEYCKYALDRAWFYYPDALPPEALAEKQRNGHIACDLSFPLEDLYVDGQPAGQVGQEIYGAGAAAVFATRSSHCFEAAPFTVFCNHFLLTVDRPSPRALAFTLAGTSDCEALLALLPPPRRTLPRMRVTAGGKSLRPRHRERRSEYRAPAGTTITIEW